jgi:hypothetical protein
MLHASHELLIIMLRSRYIIFNRAKTVAVTKCGPGPLSYYKNYEKKKQDMKQRLGNTGFKKAA